MSELKLRMELDVMEGRYARVTHDVLGLLTTALAASEKGHTEVVRQRIEAAIDDLVAVQK